MIKSLFYKEWLKIRWIFLSLAGISVVAVFYIFLNVSHGIEINGPVNFWSYIIYKKYPIALDLEYLPLITGIVLGIVQFFPEINSGRLKLTLHLPMRENKILISMLLLAGGLLTALFIFDLAIFALVSSIYFPLQLTFYNLIIIIPFYIAGLLGYLATATVMVEPVWSRRVPQIVFFLGLISIILSGGEFTGSLILFLVILCSLSILTILLSGFYYKRGIK